MPEEDAVDTLRPPGPWLMMSQARPFSVLREESPGTVAQLRGSSSGSGFWISAVSCVF